MLGPIEQILILEPNFINKSVEEYNASHSEITDDNNNSKAKVVKNITNNNTSNTFNNIVNQNITINQPIITSLKSKQT